MYRIEILEERLQASPLGRKIATVIEAHSAEVMLLVNHNRQVVTTWHRNHGPEFMGLVMRSGYDADFSMPKELHGVTLAQLLRRMASALQDVGTPALKKAIGTHYAEVMHLAQRCDSLREALAEIDKMNVEPQ